MNDNIALGKIKNFRIGERDMAIKLFNIFKDSDALDRVRLGDLDTRYLPTLFQRGLVALATTCWKP
ncbi:MAG: hypothetical protein ACYC0Q_01815 [Eubacteriales bacterium]